MAENRFARVAPVVVGGLLLLESVAVLFVAMFTAVVGGLVGALAFGVGAGSATNRQIAETTLVMGASLASPFLVALVLAAGGTFLVLRRGKSLVIAAGVVALVAQVVLHFVVAEGVHTADWVVAGLHLGAIAVAFAFVPARRAIAAA